jgi:hypothetical protein
MMKACPWQHCSHVLVGGGILTMVCRWSVRTLASTEPATGLRLARCSMALDGVFGILAGPRVVG